MKPLYVLLVGVAVGWAASGVDWSRDAEAQIMTAEDRLGGDIPAHANNLIQDDQPRVNRFQISSYGDGSTVGCYVVDSMTGRIWHANHGSGVQEVAKVK